MKTIALAAAVTGATLAAAAAAAPSPVATAPGLVVSQGGRIYVEGRPIARGTQPAWSRDGSKIAFVRNGEILVADADGSHERRLTRRKPGLHWPANSPAWAPDGSRIAFSGTRDLYSVRLADGKLSRLTFSEKSWLGNYTPAYSPDGKKIAFSRNTNAFNTDIFVMSANGTNMRRLTRSEGADGRLGEEHGPTWSPDGRTIVFVTNRDSRSLELWSIGSNGAGERQITFTAEPRYDEDLPRFSRDGKRLLYTHGGRVATVALDGSGVRELGGGASADWR